MAIGETVVACQSGSLTMLVGSCIGLFLYSPAARVAVACHILLADSAGRTAVRNAAPQAAPHAAPRGAPIADPIADPIDALENAPGRYADTAVAESLRCIVRYGGSTSDVVASVIGGANMFGSRSKGRIGVQNETVVKQHLLAHGVPVSLDDCGEHSARRIHMDVQSGLIKIVKLVPWAGGATTRPARNDFNAKSGGHS